MKCPPRRAFLHPFQEGSLVAVLLVSELAVLVVLLSREGWGGAGGRRRRLTRCSLRAGPTLLGARCRSTRRRRCS